MSKYIDADKLKYVIKKNFGHGTISPILELIDAQPTVEHEGLKQEPCEDCVSRQAVINAIANTCFWLSADNWTELMKCISSLPPVTPQPKPGHWKVKSFHEVFCDNCGFDFDIMRNDFIDMMNFCPKCGAKIIEQ